MTDKIETAAAQLRGMLEADEFEGAPLASINALDGLADMLEAAAIAARVVS